MLARYVLAIALVTTNGVVGLDAVYPNPATYGDAGEFVVLTVDEPTSLDGYALSDGESTVPLPDRVVRGTVAITDNATMARSLTEYTVIETSSGLSLSNGGETVTLRSKAGVVSSATYGRAPTAEIWRAGEWTPIGATSYPVRTRTNVPATAFALPDDPAAVASTLASADHRILLAGYTLTSSTVAESLIAAHRKGTDVAVLLEASPVGGTPQSQIDVVDRLVGAGIEVTVSGGDRGRYRYHHAKYAVVDDRILVTSENWKPSGVGGHASRGWGMTLRDPVLANHLATVFAADAGWVDGLEWESLNHSGQQSPAATDTFSTRFPATNATVDEVRVLVTPDNAEPALLDLMREANASIQIQQVSIDPEGPLLAAAVDAARRGVSVDVLLGSAWYVETENRRLARNLSARAKDENLPIDVRVAEPRSRYDHLHVKGIVVDRRHTVVGSINWNPGALRENREVAVVVSDAEVAAYYARIFRADWRGAAWRLHWSTIGGLVVAVVIAILVASNVRFTR
ncbi:MAG: phosphatidylserine/phosphatidylglycerophosphate/cardiolipin synthase family protein [Halanaeroarchaeum sp.]